VPFCFEANDLSRGIRWNCNTWLPLLRMSFYHLLEEWSLMGALFAPALVDSIPLGI
jgi:hypothetical protein